MLKADWIRPQKFTKVSPVFLKEFKCEKDIKRATLKVSARGVYTALINGNRVGSFVLAPGWTEYDTRIQLQTYDVTDMLKFKNEITITLSSGWYIGRISLCKGDDPFEKISNITKKLREAAVIAELTVKYADGTTKTVLTDDSWLVGEGPLRFADIYDGEIYDATKKRKMHGNAVVANNNDKSVLVPQIGEEVCEHERIKPVKLIVTPKGETVIDFGQNLTGYPEFTVNASKGDRIHITVAEILDKDGNFYNENYRDAKSDIEYICCSGLQTHKPEHTFYGFRYIRLNEFPCKVDLQDFTAIVVHSNIKRTGRIVTSDPMLNQLFSNIIWGQKDNFLDIPTDCPQRNERLGWTGDAQVFARAASYNFNVDKFFEKWLGDLAIAQEPNGAINPVIPHHWPGAVGGAAWSDAVTICPWQMYLTYGDSKIFKKMYPVMKKWLDYVTNTTTKPGLWLGGNHFGDWLELTAKYGECKGKTRDDLIATAYYAYSCQLFCKVGKLLKKDVLQYEKLYKTIVSEFQKYFKDDYRTQTEYIVALYFGLAKNKTKASRGLVEKIHNDGDKMQTGFVGTPYILHVLTDIGEVELAYKLLLRKRYPSWLYPITKGATTMWEHWDGIRPNGDIWPASMNSYNHYAYGSVADWIYCVSAGINTVEQHPGFEEIHFAPKPTDSLQSLYAEIDTRFGTVHSGWFHKEGEIIYEIETPVCATAEINGVTYNLKPGKYRF